MRICSRAAGSSSTTALPKRSATGFRPPLRSSRRRHHFTQAGLAETAIEWWNKAGEQALQHAAYVETIGHLGKAISLMESLPASAARRRQEVKLQVARITPLIHVKGYAAPETKAAAERARVLVDEAERAGESLESLVLLSVLYGSVTTNIVAFNGDLVLRIAAQFLALAQKEDNRFAPNGPSRNGCIFTVCRTHR
jgi:hypothetical protein